jgi:hypothetical protein
MICDDTVFINLRHYEDVLEELFVVLRQSHRAYHGETTNVAVAVRMTDV